MDDSEYTSNQPGPPGPPGIPGKLNMAYFYILASHVDL